LVSDAFVKLKQMVLMSGQPATNASTSKVGARNSQAARMRARFKSECRGPIARAGETSIEVSAILVLRLCLLLD
jgi:hypothetical protein